MDPGTTWSTSATRSNNPAHTVLVVDDEEPIRNYLAEALEQDGYDCRRFSNSLAALRYLEGGERPADLLLTDIRMPGVDGLELLRSAKNLRPELPVVLVSGLYELTLALDALELGADEYLRKPVGTREVVGLAARYLRSDVKQREQQIQQALEEFLGSGSGAAAFSAPIAKVFRKLGFKRYETLQHSKRVAAYSLLLGRRCGVSDRDLDRLELGALLHDIGKIGVPRNVLLKPGALNDEEWEVMKTHPTIGFRLLAPFDELQPEAQVVYSHHERFDGSGYPRGLRGGEIPLWARLFSIVDAWDALTSDRAYRSATGYPQARAEIAQSAGTQFDPQIVPLFLVIPDDQLEAVRTAYPDDATTPDG